MKILQGQFKPCEFVRTIHSAEPEPNTSLDDVLNPEFWSHVAKSVRVGDRIEVVPRDKTFFAELYVREITPSAVHVVLLRKMDFTSLPTIPQAPTAEPDTVVKFRGAAGWSVVRLSDKTVLVEGLPDKAAAEAWQRKESHAALA